MPGAGFAYWLFQEQTSSYTSASEVYAPSRSSGTTRPRGQVASGSVQDPEHLAFFSRIPHPEKEICHPGRFLANTSAGI